MRKFLIIIIAGTVITATFLFDVLRVTGDSMEPQFCEGNFVILRRNRFINHRPSVGEIVVFTNPVTNRLNIKRCSVVDNDSIFVTGTNLSESTDSRHFGRINTADIKGWVWIKI